MPVCWGRCTFLLLSLFSYAVVADFELKITPGGMEPESLNLVYPAQEFIAPVTGPVRKIKLPLASGGPLNLHFYHRYGPGAHFLLVIPLVDIRNSLIDCSSYFYTYTFPNDDVVVTAGGNYLIGFTGNANIDVCYGADTFSGGAAWRYGYEVNLDMALSVFIGGADECSSCAPSNGPCDLHTQDLLNQGYLKNDIAGCTNPGYIISLLNNMDQEYNCGLSNVDNCNTIVCEKFVKEDHRRNVLATLDCPLN